MLLSWNILKREMSWVCFWRERVAGSCCLGGDFSICGDRSEKSAKAMSFAVEALEFEHACVWRRAERAGRTVKVIQRKCQQSTCKVQERNGILYHRWNGTFSHLFADERILHIWKPSTILHLGVRFQWKEQIPQALLVGFALELKPPNYI